MKRGIGLKRLAVFAMAMIVGFGALTIGSASAQSADARVRITHASPDAPAVDIWVNGQPAVTGLAFGNSTDLISLPAASYDVAVTPAGSTDPEADAVIAATLTLEAGAAYDVFAVGYLDEISAQVYPLDLSPIAEGNARVQVVHASVDAPSVDVLANGSALLEGLAFPDASGFLEVPAGSYDIQVAVSSTGDIALDLPGTSFEAGQVYVVAAIGEVGAGTLTALPLVASADMATGGETSSSSTATTETHTTPATGVGVSAEKSSALAYTMAAVALVLLATVGGMQLSGRTIRG